jgi:hypothetical protein
MLTASEFDRLLLTHQLAPAGPIPSVCDPDGVYPYPSFAQTSWRPTMRRYRFAVIENDAVRATVCPDLGGKVHSLVDKRSGKEVLFTPASVCPVRILPRMGFIPGGIEVSFPISHSPVQLERVDYELERTGDRLYLWCGERELRSGLQWTVEYSLGESDTGLTQRTCFWNPTDEGQPWMSWSNAALPARADSEFHFPDGLVLSHGAELKKINWAKDGPRRVADLERMTGFFWVDADVCAFGGFTPSLGHGLYHAADPAMAPGIKLWSYGLGRHESWGKAASLSGEGYFEIQAGPLRDQSVTATLAPGQRRAHVELWIPSAGPLDIRQLPKPDAPLVPESQIRRFSWPPRPEVEYWRGVCQAFARKAMSELPLPPGPEQNLWAPSGMMELGLALEWAVSGTGQPQQDAWRFQLGAWLAGRGKVSEALEVLMRARDDGARALAGRLHLRARHDARAAGASLGCIEDEAMALHPQIVVERDLALASLGRESIGERERWLSRLANADDEWLIERKATLLLDQGKPGEARALLEATRFQLVHQRYERSQLWARIEVALNGGGAKPPPSLGEDDLARFGAYRQFE